MQKIVFVFLVLAGVALAADRTITDKVRKQQMFIYIFTYNCIMQDQFNTISIQFYEFFFEKKKSKFLSFILFFALEFVFYSLFCHVFALVLRYLLNFQLTRT